MKPDRASLLQRALGVFIAIAVSMGAFLWAGKTFIERPVNNVYLDGQRLAALRTFERAIVPIKSVRGYEGPTAEQVRDEFAFCAESLKTPKEKPAARRSTNPCTGAGPAEEIACHLRTINAKLETMSGDRRRNREGLLEERYVVDLPRWTESIRKDGVACRDAQGAARQLAARDGRLLGLFAWRELASRKVAAANFAPGQAVKVPGRVLEQRNPWGGVPGCIYYGTGTKLLYVTDRRQSNRLACLAMRPKDSEEKGVTGVFLRTSAEQNARRGEPAQMPPESLDVILADLDNIRLPWKDLFRAYTEAPAERIGETPAEPVGEPSAASKPVAASHGPNQLARMKHKVDAGFNVHLTIDPEAQRVVQETSACYSGDEASCRRLGLANDKLFSDFTRNMYEKAAVRMAAVALIDIPTGRIEALGSAHSECFRQEYDGPGRNARDCPNLPTSPHYEPDRLLNHALYTDALPGSIIKPIMATGFLSDPKYRAKVASEKVSPGFLRLQDELKSSDSVAFLNRMFCADKGWTGCERPQAIQQAALRFGWNGGCEEGSFRCGRLNVLFGHPDTGRVRQDTTRRPLGASIMYGRVLTEPASAKRPGDLQMMRDFSFDPAVAAACARGDYYKGTDTQHRGWRKCHNRRIVYLESEGWGQGNARTTPVGAAGIVARLAAAANGQASLRLPYLVDRISDANAQPFELAAQQFHLADPVKIEIPQEDAALIVGGMLSHKGYGMPAGSRPGTAHSACLRVFDAATCNRIDWIAGKTGTPPYGNDGLTLKEIREKCLGGQKPAHADSREARADLVASCNHEQPYKWYIAAFRTDDAQPGFNKAIAVLTERNWYRSGPQAGKVQSPGDKEMNLSAEIAFRIMARLRPAPGRIEAHAPPSPPTEGKKT
jgi:hypothetical protein